MLAWTPTSSRLDDLNSNLAEQGRQLSRLPHAFQWNKRDLADAVATEELDRRLNLFGAPAVSTVATEGTGVFELLERITKLVVEGYRAELPTGAGKGEERPLFLDAEEVGLTNAIRELADSQPLPAPSSARRGPGRAAAGGISQAADRASAPALAGKPVREAQSRNHTRPFRQSGRLLTGGALAQLGSRRGAARRGRARGTGCVGRRGGV